MRIFAAFLFHILVTAPLFSQQIPFNYSIALRPVTIANLPGIHSYAFAQSGGKWLVIGGRRDGLHSRQPFSAFPAQNNNTDILVIDINTLRFWSASVNTLETGLKEQLQSTNMNFYQDNDSLYIIGGYGYSNSAQDHVTYPNLTSVSVSGLITAISNSLSITPYFKQITEQRFAVNGGQLGKIGDTFYLVGGHRFEGRYNPMGNPSYTQTYVDGIKMFRINNSGTQLNFSDFTFTGDQVHLHRRDYNLVPQIFQNGEHGYMVSSGVFQNGVDLPFLYPVDIKAAGHVPQPSFNQYLSNYHCAKAALFDSLGNTMHTIFFGGISQYAYVNGALVQDNSVPFVKTISRVSRDGGGNLAEFVFPTEMPALIGAGSEFILNPSVSHYKTDIVRLSGLAADSTLIGHILGGIYSPQKNPFTANQASVTNAHSTIYEVWLVRSDITGSKPINGDNPLKVTVFPNPSLSGFTLSLDLPYEGAVILFITDITGKIVGYQHLEDTRKGKQSIEISQMIDLPDGTYFFNLVFDGKFSAIQKVIIGGN